MPNTRGPQPRARRTDTIALVLPDMTNPFFTTLAQGVETAAREAGIALLLANSDEREDEERRLVEMLLQRQVDGLLLVPAGAGAETIRRCRDRGVPLVVVDRRPQVAGRGRRASRLRGRRARARPAAGRASGIAAWPCSRDRPPSPRRSTGWPGSARAARGRGRTPRTPVLHGAFTIDSGHDMTLAGDAACGRGPRRCSRPTTSSPSASCTRSRSSACAFPTTWRSWASTTCPGRWSRSRSSPSRPSPPSRWADGASACSSTARPNPDRPAQDVVLPTELVIRRSSGGPVAHSAGYMNEPPPRR